MFRKIFESMAAGQVKVLIGRKTVKLDNSYIHNLIHGFILAAEHLVPAAPRLVRPISSTMANRSTCSSSPGRSSKRAGSAGRGCGCPVPWSAR
ncbi:3-beta hydroxysteroid dehydrogenase/isomerase family protein [Mycobacterium xenopi 4042]|uniref:3-beta hydroxysteroid dehydrogenase/isomerase family protein n=1 Tax=Mycobacterium xenopi 4042 TaxID=1299334 RepID=X8ALJ5_MYCXE|nr:3-beta hydroxysteroid dehydrogenase/isomerase family protein [Mycobacterium xenopi 4042]